MNADSGYAMRMMINICRMHRKSCECAAADLEVHRSQHFTLMKIGEAEEGLSQTELSKKLEISPAAVAVTLKKLEAGGYVKKSMGKDDNRYNNVRITDKGREVVKKTRELFNEIDVQMFECLSDEEMKNFILCLEKINERNGHRK